MEQNGSQYAANLDMLQPGDNLRCYVLRTPRHNYMNQRQTITLLVVYLSLIIINVATNLFAYVIFAREKHQTVLVKLLKALSIFEVFFQIFMMAQLLCDRVVMLGMVAGGSWTRLSVYCHVFCGVTLLLSALHISRNWMVVIISAFRFEAVCRALSSTHVFRVDRVAPMAVASFLAAMLASAPRFFERSCIYCPAQLNFMNMSVTELYNLHKEPFNVTGDLLLEMMGERLLSADWYKYVYRVGLLLLIQSGGPIILVFFFSSRVLVTLAEQRKVRRRLDGGRARPSASSSRQSGSGDLLVILLSTIFFLCETPSFLSKLLADRIKPEADVTLAYVANLATLVDTTCNIFVYTVSNRSFRETLFRMFCFKQAGRAGGDNYTLAATSCGQGRPSMFPDKTTTTHLTAVAVTVAEVEPLTHSNTTSNGHPLQKVEDD